MTTWIILFRGINVGGKNILPMTKLVQDLQSLKLENIKTYIQSGNVIYQSSRKISTTLGDKIATAIENRHGFKPHVLILSADQWEKAMVSNPFPQAETKPKTLHLFFLASPVHGAELIGVRVFTGGNRETGENLLLSEKADRGSLKQDAIAVHGS